MQGCSGTGNLAFTESIITPQVSLHLEKYDDLDTHEMDQIKRYSKNDVRRVSKLGEGCFSNVFLVVSQSEKKKMALKCLDHEKIRSPQEFLTASRDLISEANMLSQLDHESIVKVRGVCTTSFSESYVEDGEGYFFTMDVMQGTLRNHIRLWRNDPTCYKKRNFASLLMGTSQQKLDMDKMKKRIEYVALGISQAMDYIHQRGIILRDLKPGNIGFSETTGKVCLFDFGFARYLESCDHDLICGTPNYMAPEVMQAQGYSLKSDVYSFAMVLYKICSLRKLTSRTNKPFTIHRGAGNPVPRHNGFAVRPSLDCIPCRATQHIIEDCWCSDPQLRPTFEQISIAMSNVVLAKKLDGLSLSEERTVANSNDDSAV